MRRLVGSTLAFVCLAAPLAAQQQDYAANMHRAHMGDAPVASPASAAVHGAEALEGEVVTYGTVNGRALKGYLVKAAGGKQGPAVIVVHEWWGINDNIKQMTRNLAAAGYTALAVDLFDGKVATTPDAALKLYQGAMAAVPAGEANLGAAVKYLKGWGATSIGSIGWCFGGHWSLRTGLVGGADVQAVAMYYGAPITDVKELGRLKAPVLGLFGGKDGGIPVAAVREMQAAAKGLKKTFDVQVYENADHAFANPSGNAYDKTAADDAMARTLAFFKVNLK